MLRKTMIALLAFASISMLAPDVALARGGGGGGGGHGGGGGGHGGGFGGGFGGGGRGFSGGGFGGAGFGAAAVRGGSFGNSFARSTAVGAAGAAGVAGFQAGRFATGGWHHGGFHGFRHGRRFFVAGGFWGPGYYDDYYDYPYYADDSYYYGGNCYIVRQRVHTSNGWRIRPVQVCG
jgi:hypothetical protein